MIHDPERLSSEALLARLDGRTAEDWSTVGQVLAELERRSRVAADGRPWLEVVGERLEEIGAPRSAGHLRKMRRAVAYLQRERPHLASAPDEAALERVFLTSLEFAERISGLDPEAGRRALSACLAGAPPAELQALYKAAQVDHADQRSPRQIAWDARRKAASRDSREAEAVNEDKVARSFQTDSEVWWGLPGNVQTFSPGVLRPYLKSAGTGVLVTTEGGRRVLGGFRLQACKGWKQEDWQRLLESVLLHANFFDRYWLALDTGEREARTFWSQLSELAAPNVGLVRTDLANSDQVVRLGLAEDPPSPDRRGIVLNALLQRR